MKEMQIPNKKMGKQILAWNLYVFGGRDVGRHALPLNIHEHRFDGFYVSPDTDLYLVPGSIVCVRFQC